MSRAGLVLAAALVLLVAVYGAWFGGDGQWVAMLVFALPALVLAALVVRGQRNAGFWSGVLALLWFSHGVMVAWTRAPERGFAVAEIVLALLVVFAASLPGLRARFAKRSSRS